MPENGHVSQDQCETRRYHCGEATAKAYARMEKQFNGFLKRIEDQVAPLVTQQAGTDARAKSNTHRINWLYAILGVVVAGVFLGAVVAALGAGG